MKLRESNAVVTEVSMEQDDEGGGGGDKVRKIEVSGENISLVVDFSNSLTGTSSDNAFESNGNQTQECLVGNLVWAMRTKSKKWWPGEVVGYKADAKESFMVRYLGDSQLESWCAPSKLRPFKESFERVVSQRHDVGFFVAVEEAMTLLRNSLRLEMTCSCMAERNVKRAARKTKPLILREFSVDRLEPEEFVAQLKGLAVCGFSRGGILEVTVMQSRLSAFYSFCGHKQIPMDQLHQNEVRKSFNGSKMEESEFVGSPSVVGGSSRRRFRKEWFRKFVSEVDNVSAREDLVDTSPSDLVSKLKMFAVDSTTCSEETENVGLFEWFFSKFRISVFHDENSYRMQLANMAALEDLMVAKVANPGTELRTYKSRNVGKSKVEPVCGVSVANTEKKTFESQKSSEKSMIDVSGVVSVANIEKKISEKSMLEPFCSIPVADFKKKTSESQKISEMSKIEVSGGVPVADTERKTSESLKNSEKSKIEVSGCVPVADTERKTSESLKNSEKSKIEVSGCVPVADTEKKTSESQKNSDKSKIEVTGGVSAANTEQKTFESSTMARKYRTYQRASKLKKIKDTISHSGFSSSVANERFAEACMADTLSRPAATLVPDLNSGGNALASAESDHLPKPETLVPPPNAPLPQKEERPFSMMLNFQAAAAPYSNYGTSGSGFVSSLTDLERKFTSADLCAKVTGPKKRGRKRKNPEVAHATNGIPDLNGISKEPAASVQPQAEPIQRRKRRKKEEMPSRSTTRGITILVLKFSSKESMPSKEDLTSTFSAFGPLDASETHVYEEFSGAEVAFVSSGDAVEAVKSLDKANPFGGNLVSFRLQQKLINVYRNIAPRMPVISHVNPLQKPKNTPPISVESMKQNLLMMTAMLDKSGDHLSRETKAKLKSDISALLEKISSMPSSSFSS